LLPSLKLLIYSLPTVIACFRALIFKQDAAWFRKDRTAQAAGDLQPNSRDLSDPLTGFGKFHRQIAESYTVPAVVLLDRMRT